MHRFGLKPLGVLSTTGAPPDPRARAERTVLVLEAVTAVDAFGGGAVMIADPSGQLIGFAPAMLDRIPFSSWLLPGIALVGSNGVMPTVVALATMRGQEWTSRFGHIAVGCVLLAWPVTETALFGYPLTGEPKWLRPAVAGTGVAIACIGVWLRSSSPRSRAGCRVRVQPT